MGTPPVDAEGPDSTRRRLESLREELRATLAGTRDQAETVTLDQSAVGRLSRVDALQQQAMAQAQERRMTLRLAQVEGALARLDNDAYGSCVKCGDEIADKRLQARPEAPFCLDCAP